MAVVNIKVDPSDVEDQLDALFNAAVTYEIQLASSEPVDPVTVTFKNATTVGSEVIVELDSAAYFVIPSGTELDGFELFDNNSKLYLIESVTPRTYTANGTYTISNLIIKVGV